MRNRRFVYCVMFNAKRSKLMLVVCRLLQSSWTEEISIQESDVKRYMRCVFTYGYGVKRRAPWGDTHEKWCIGSKANGRQVP